MLTASEMGEADRLTAAAGTAGILLMERAGSAVADEVRRRWPRSSLCVLCGPGNNGGDGFVAARHLAAEGWPVRLGLLGSRADLHGDAAHHAALWTGPVEPISRSLLDGAALVIDALFGAGLSRPLGPELGPILDSLRETKVPVLAIDVPSGVSGDSGAMLGPRGGDEQHDVAGSQGRAVSAAVTVTFFRKKPGHLLLPGRTLAGDVVVADIGIGAEVLVRILPKAFENGPALWCPFPWPTLSSHKYSRGHALVSGGYPMTGAARMAARAAGRVGAGLVTVAAPEAAFTVYAAALESVIVHPIAAPEDFDQLIADPRRNAMLVGPGAGAPEETRRRVLAALKTGRACVIDADGITAFEGQADDLIAAIAGPVVFTPHAGEFARVFGPIGDDKLGAARRAAAKLGAVLLLKGADTVIAAPDGRAAINANGTPFLATAGAGDVLAGLILGLLAQGMPPFEAAAAGAWIHGASASSFGPGMVAEDVIDGIPAVLRALRPDC